MPDGRAGDCIYCPNCHNWQGAEIVKWSPSGYEKTPDGRDVWVSRVKCKCTICKHKWTKVEGR